MAHAQNRSSCSLSKRQLASRTPFGWVLIGDKVSYPTSSQQPAPILALSSTNPSVRTARDEELDKFNEQFLKQTNEQIDQLQGNKDDELPGYSQDEVRFIQLTASKVRQRQD